LSAPDARLSRRNGKEHFAGLARTWPQDLNKAAVELLLNVTSLVTAACRSALQSTDTERGKRDIGHAKRSYASAIRCAGRLSFSVQDVQAFESRTVELEDIVSKLERRWADSESRNYDAGGSEEEQSPP
jgi:hypothetical protein